MKKQILSLFILFASVGFSIAQISPKIGSDAKTDHFMSSAYWDLWNPQVQARIDKDIDQYRKADAILNIPDLPPGAEVKVKQVSHDFVFGANIFNFNQLGTIERNRKYKELFGSLFNSATVAFYWKKFEMEPNRPRYREEYWDTEEYWNQVKEPNTEPHWRRPAPDPIIDFLESKGIKIHGHPIIWGITSWHHPEWLFEQFCPDEEKDRLNEFSQSELWELTPAQIEELAPIYTQELKRLFEKRVVDLANYYGDRIHSWDVVNESALDYHGDAVTGDPIITSSRWTALLPGDYTYHAFKTANRVFPRNVLLNINDYYNHDIYVNQVKDLLSNGCRIDIIGSQMHMFNPQHTLEIAAGEHRQTPQQIWDRMGLLSQTGLPIHLSEITITAPGDDTRGREIQAVVARNLYRLWFSIENMMGITWWNIVDDCGAPGEPLTSGLFTRNMEPKPSFYALNELINEEWKTRMTVKVAEDGTTSFRGFKGRYIVSWKDKFGEVQQAEFYLKKDGDGFQTFP